MVRLVFRPYTQVWRAICTSAPRRTSTRVSPGFILLRHSSPSFGSQQRCSAAAPSRRAPLRAPMLSGPGDGASPLSPPCSHRQAQRGDSHLSTPCVPSLSLRTPPLVRFRHLRTRTAARLLGPCFKTGRLKPWSESVSIPPHAGRRTPPPAGCPDG